MFASHKRSALLRLYQSAMNACTVYVSLLLAVAVVQVYCQKPICYHVGANCRPRGGKNSGGSWLMAMEESRLRAQQGREPTAAEREAMEEFSCECCCKQFPTCIHGDSMCGSIRSCGIHNCYRRILGKVHAVSDSL